MSVRVFEVYRRILWALLLGASVGAAAASGAALERVDVTKQKDRYLLAGEIVIDAPRAKVYAVITDFERLHELDEGIAEARIVERVDDRTTVVYTRLSGCVLVFCRDVERLERVEKVSETEIVANVVPEENGDVAYSSARWLLTAEGDATRVVYETEVDPSFWIPPVIGPAIVRNVLRKRVAATLGNLEQAARERG